MLREQYINNSVSEELLEKAESVSEKYSQVFRRIDETAEYNQIKILNAFRKCKVSDYHFNISTGYGYNDTGRDNLERVYSEVFHTEDALVRPQIASGTHAITTALFGVLRPGDEMLAISGKPYDTMDEVIGLRPSPGSLADMKVTYAQADLKSDGSFDKEAIASKLCERTKLVHIQRSRGYDIRPAIPVDAMRDVISYVKSLKSDVIVFVDNCYGEFTDVIEPTDAGADLIAGSLIKNPGGGLAESGGYIAGRADLIELCGYRLIAPGIGKEVGSNFGVMRSFYQGLFMAPSVVASALKTAVLCAGLLESMGYKTSPSADAKRSDIVQVIDFDDPDMMLSFCRGIQRSSPVDSFVVPEADDMPGYDSKVVMAAGTFVSGASIELSCDGPFRPPYRVFLQGGLTYYHGRYAVLSALQEMLDIKKG